MPTQFQNDDIIVCGYPKSGTTWAARLFAEIFHCPVAGFLGSDHDEIAKEGEDRDAPFSLYKSHAQARRIAQHSSRNVIYITRHPFDVAVSMAYHHFDFTYGYPRLRDFLRSLPAGIRIHDLVRESRRKFVREESHETKLKIAVNALCVGDCFVNPVFQVPWPDQVQPFINWQDEGVAPVVIRYEDLLADPAAACKKVCDHFHYESPTALIQRAIDNQSFERKRKESRRNVKHLRKGQAGSGMEELSLRLREQILRACGDVMSALDYTADSQIEKS